MTTATKRKQMSPATRAKMRRSWRLHKAERLKKSAATRRRNQRRLVRVKG